VGLFVAIRYDRALAPPRPAVPSFQVIKKGETYV
jgi:hypothetical protein